ncbi:MAG: 50S ribosomal protein L11 methyltransferase [Firmicutes bacterium HGW-Firmicutes-14]|nr:MAG: 50S ribosomal protein L11 methyltransferase [Firmicutes bacterium HGW-Firmicutes-14]
MNWLEISVSTTREAVEPVSEILTGCGAGGVVVEDPETIRELIAGNIWDAYDIPKEILEGEHTVVKAYLPQDDNIDFRIGMVTDRLDALNRQHLPNSVKGLDFLTVREEDWANSWKAYYKPVKIGRRIIVKPTWEEYDRKPGDLVIELDPGMAFGTGTHPTTIMCVKFLEKIIRGGETVYDIGTGSGILAITAALLGAGQVKAVDIDNVAVESATANIRQNGLEEIIGVSAGNLLEGVGSQADIVIANIVADVIIEVCPAVPNVLKQGGLFVASGIIVSRFAEVLEAVGNSGLTVKETAREGEWVSLLAATEV